MMVKCLDLRKESEMKIPIVELVRLQRAAHNVEDSIPAVASAGMIASDAALITNFFDKLIDGTNITIKA